MCGLDLAEGLLRGRRSKWHRATAPVGDLLPSDMYVKRRPYKLNWGDLIRAVDVEKDRSAFRVLFEHYAPRIKALMIRGGMTNDEAEELAQETLLMVWRKADLYVVSRNGPSGWIFTIARNLRIDSVRRRREMSKWAEAELQYQFDPALQADASLMAGDDHRRVKAELAKLPPEQLELIRLSFFEDRPHGEIADELHLPLGTVKSRIRLAMKKLRDLLDDRA